MSTSEPVSKPAEVTRFRKRPVTVEARQLIDDLACHTAMAAWIEAGGGHAEIPFAEPCLYIETLEGRMRADVGDYVIKGVQGEHYPCKPDIFEATYEPVSSAEDRTEDGASERGHGGVLVGEVRALLAKHGVPHGDDTHYVIVATAGDAPAQMSIMACCDDVGHAGELLAEALENLTGAGRAIAPDSPDIIVGREDLRAYLRRTEGGDPNLRGLWESLAAAAGLGE